MKNQKAKVLIVIALFTNQCNAFVLRSSIHKVGIVTARRIQTSDDIVSVENKTEEVIPSIRFNDTDTEGSDDIESLMRDDDCSIVNEVQLKKFVKIVNKEDRGILEEDIDLAEILFDKIIDTADDALLMMRRKMRESDAIQEPRAADVLNEWYDKGQPRVLVIGTGWAGHACIKVLDTSQFRVLVISPSNHFVFTPMLASTSVGTIESMSIVESTRDSNPFVRYIEGKALDVNTADKTFKVKLGKDELTNDRETICIEENEIIDIPYDIAIYSAGVGPVLSSKNIPGLSKENVYFLKSVDDAKRLRSGVIDLLENASQPGITDKERRQLLTFVVVGGGPTGVEYCGELADFINDVTGKRKSRLAPFASLAKFTKIILIQGAPDVLPAFEANLRQSARESLEGEGVTVRTNTKVKHIIGKEKIAVVNKEDGVEDTIDCGLIVWAAGTMPLQLTETLIANIDSTCREKGLAEPSALSSRGRIPVDKWQRVIGVPDGSMLAIGDASGTVVEGGEAKLLPQTAQVAAQQGAYVARLLNRHYDLNVENSKNVLYLGPPTKSKAKKRGGGVNIEVRGKLEAKPFQFLNLGQLAYTGGGEALSQVELGDKKLFSQAGSTGFLLWRSVYIVKQVSTKTRLLVLFDWFKTQIFGRDVTRM
eukprot:99957_1